MRLIHIRLEQPVRLAQLLERVLFGHELHAPVAPIARAMELLHKCPVIHLSVLLRDAPIRGLSHVDVDDVFGVIEQVGQDVLLHAGHAQFSLSRLRKRESEMMIVSIVALLI